MKKLLFICLMSFTGFAQQQFEYSKSGMTDYVVTEVPGTAAENYQKVLKWVKENYKSPDEVIKSTIENEMIRINGSKPNFICEKNLGMESCSNGMYFIDIHFKDGKIKFDPFELNLTSGSLSSPVDLNNFSLYYRSNGEIRNKAAERYLNSFIGLFNDLNSEVVAYIKGVKKNDW